MLKPVSAWPTALKTAWADVMPGLKGVFWLSCIVNLLMFAGPLYMLQVYDRVLASQSLETLAVLSLALLGLYVVQAWFDAQRMRLMTRIAAVADDHARRPALSALIQFSAAGASPIDAARPMKDLDQLRTFVGGPAPAVFADLPWLPLFLIACFILHPWIGFLVVGGAAVLLAIGWASDRAAAHAESAFSKDAIERANLAESARRNAETVTALGLEGAIAARLSSLMGPSHTAIRTSLDATAGWAAASRSARLGLQSAVLGLGAVLVILGDMSAGAMIAASILAGRALHPAELAIGQWTSFVQARAALNRLKEVFSLLDRRPQRRAQAGNIQNLSAEGLVLNAPTGQPVLAGVSFQLQAGDVLALIGPSGSGKTTLAKALAGIWRPMRGTIRADGIDILQIEPASLALTTGYLAQDVALFDATVGENIARLTPDAPGDLIEQAAEAAGATAMIRRFAAGFDTPSGAHGSALSAGQRQRVGLARALYGSPALVILDEPNANLDTAGEAALGQALEGLKARGAITIVIAHRPNILRQATKILVLQGGQMRAFGPRDKVLAAMQSKKDSKAVIPFRRAKEGPAS